jgi:hypothetical protein
MPKRCRFAFFQGIRDGGVQLGVVEKLAVADRLVMRDRLLIDDAAGADVLVPTSLLPIVPSGKPTSKPLV